MTKFRFTAGFVACLYVSLLTGCKGASTDTTVQNASTGSPTGTGTVGLQQSTTGSSSTDSTTGSAVKGSSSGGPKSTSSSTSTGGDDVESQRIFPLAGLPTVKCSAGGKSFLVWVMDSGAKRDEGLMYLHRKDIPHLHGMLFVFPTPQQCSFWMENTLAPLDIVFVDANKKVLNIQEGAPLDPSPLPSDGLALYVIEFIQGDAAKLGIKAGVTLKIPDSVLKDAS